MLYIDSAELDQPAHPPGLTPDQHRPLIHNNRVVPLYLLADSATPRPNSADAHADRQSHRPHIAFYQQDKSYQIVEHMETTQSHSML